MHRLGRHAVLQLRPVLAAVNRGVDAPVHADKQQVRVVGILADDVHRLRREIAGDRRPCGAKVGRLVEVRLEVVIAKTGIADIRRARRVPRGNHAGHVIRGVAGDLVVQLRPALGAILAAVLGHPHVPIVGADVEQIAHERGFVDRGDGLVLDVAVAALADGRRRGHEKLCLVVVREIGADRGPRVTAVGGLQQEVRPVVDGRLVVRRDQDRRRPRVAEISVGILDAFRLARGEVGPGDRALL